MTTDTQQTAVFLSGDGAPIATTATVVEVMAALGDAVVAADGNPGMMALAWVPLPLVDGAVGYVRPLTVTAILPMDNEADDDEEAE